MIPPIVDTPPQHGLSKVSHGHEADGTEAEGHCRWRHEGGSHTYETTMDGIIEERAPHMAEITNWAVGKSAS